MNIILIGKSACGKSTIEKELVNRGFISGISYTTRPMREREIDGVDYHFIDDMTFDSMIDNDMFIEYRSYNVYEGDTPAVWRYGTAKDNPDNTVFVVDIGGARALINHYAMTGEGGDALINGIFNALKIVGFLLAIIFAMTNLFKQIEREADPIESFFKILIEICITGIFIINLDLIVGFIIKLGQAFIEIVMDAGSEGGAIEATIQEDQILKTLLGSSTGGSFWTVLGIAVLFFPWVMTVLLDIAAQFIVISILIEIGIRRAFMPLAVADIYQEGLRSPGFRNIKRLIGAFLKMGICLFVSKLGGTLVESMVNNLNTSTVMEVFQYFFASIAVQATCIGVMFKAGEYANEFAGV